MKKLKVCFITEDFYPDFIGGQGIYGYNLVKQLGKLGNRVVVLAENRSERRQFWGVGSVSWRIRVILVPFCFGNQLLLALWEYLIFRWKLNKHYFDILHANQLSGLFFIIFRPKNVGKIVVSVHNTNFDMAQKTDSSLKWLLYQPLIWLERMVYRRADGLLFNSPKEEKELLNYYQIDKKLTKSVYPGVEMPKFTKGERQKARMEIRKNMGWPKNSKIVLYVGRLVKRKQVDILIKSVKLIKSLKLLIIGQGVEREVLEQIASSNVKFLGFVADTRPYLLASDLFVTVSEAEGGFLLTALEAASFGLPLILSPSAAGFPIIKEGENGYIVKPTDPKQLADKIKLVIRAVRVIREMGEESRKIARKFSWEKCSRQTFKFYQFLLEDNFPKPGTLTQNF